MALSKQRDAARRNTRRHDWTRSVTSRGDAARLGASGLFGRLGDVLWRKSGGGSATRRGAHTVFDFESLRFPAVKESRSWGARTRLPSVSGLSEITWKKERTEADSSRGRRCVSLAAESLDTRNTRATRKRRRKRGAYVEETT